MTSSNCAKFASALADVTGSDAYVDVRGHFYTTYVSDMEALVGWSNIS